MRFSSYGLLLIGIFSFVLLFYTGAQGEEVDVAQIRKAIEEGITKWVEAFNKGDVAGVVAIYADDAMLLPPNGEVIQGKQGIQEFWSSALQILKDVSLNTLEIGGSGDTGYRIGKYTLKVQPEGQQPAMDSGKYVEVWKRQADGSWKLHADIWNSSLPPQPAQ
ncbi:MAG: SgcJ/EcaC family oxidoreductase [Nitrospira sp.]|nr:SgcJ/EcaC family oxidoreductase [Nitrospira sp.]